MKICNHEGCVYNQFGGGYCKYHQRDRGDKKNSKSPRITFGSKKGKIKKITAKGRKQREQKSKLSEKDKLFWATIWEEREHVCYNCGCYLGEEPLTLFFDHILEKSSQLYAHLRYVKENICLLCWDCHTNKSMIKKLIKLREETIKKLMGGKEQKRC